MNTLEKLKELYGVHYEYIELPAVGRNDLAKWLHDLDFKRGVEVGVAEGDYSRVLLDANPQMEIYGVDPWIPYAGYKDYQKESTFARMYARTLEQTKDFPNYKIIKKFSVEAAEDFEDNSLDFVYLDGNHSGEEVMKDMEAWNPKLKKGGILAGHDFTGRWPSLKKAVVAFAEIHHKKLFVLGLERKDLGVYRDTSRSWMMV